MTPAIAVRIAPHNDGRNSHFEIPEERVHKQVDHDERRENCIQNTHKDKTPPEPIHACKLGNHKRLMRIMHPSINAARFLLFRNTFLTWPLLSKRYSIRQNCRFHSRERVSVRPLPSSVGQPFGRGTRKSSNSLLKSAMRKFSCRMIRLAMSCASSLAPSPARGREDDKDSSVSGLELRMAPMRRTTSGHEIVWMSSYRDVGR